jgi:hypothetical protein
MTICTVMNVMNQRLDVFNPNTTFFVYIHAKIHT